MVVRTSSSVALFYGQLHASALLNMCPTALGHSAAAGSLQAGPAWERELWLQVQADAGVSPVGCSPAQCSPTAAEGPPAHGQEAQHSYARSERKERRNLGWVRTEGIYQYREFFTYYLLSHTHAHACPGNPAFLQAQKGHQSIILGSVFKQSEVTFERTPRCSVTRCCALGQGQVELLSVSGALGLEAVPAAGLGPALRSPHQASELALHFGPLPAGSKEHKGVSAGTGHT